MAIEILSACFSEQPTEKLDRKVTDTTDDTDEEPLEVNFDTNQLTYLYQAIQDKAFMAAIDFLESGKPEVNDQVRTWVTRYEEDKPNKIRWSHLPLHAALLFKAPTRVIELLVELYPKAVRCTNDQQMLPVHLAFRYGASDAVFYLLLKAFPDSMKAADHKGRVPLDFAKDGESWRKGEIINMYIDHAKNEVIKLKHDEQMRNMQETLEEKEKSISQLQTEKQELADTAKSSKNELEELKQLLQEANERADNAVSAATAAATEAAKEALKSTKKITAKATATATTVAPKKKKKKGFFGK